MGAWTVSTHKALWKTWRSRGLRGIKSYLSSPKGFSGGKESACRYRRHRFYPWVRNIPWRRKWQSTPVFLPGKSHGQKSLVSYSPWGCKRVGYDLVTKQQQQIHPKQPSPLQPFDKWLKGYESKRRDSLKIFEICVIALVRIQVTA